MQLRALIADDAELLDDLDPVIAGLTADSRTLRPGDLFAALPGTRTDGRQFVDDAIKAGAGAILGGPWLRHQAIPVPRAVAVEPRRALARIAARYFGRQPRILVAVTGTSGKTSIAEFVRQIWTGAGHAAASIGTLGVVAPGMERSQSLTTPDPVALQKTLAELADRGVDHAVIEASSHALDQYRLDGTRLGAAAFSNLGRDHFDYHGTADAYFAAKARLFEDLLPAGATAVLNADAPEFPALAAIAGRRGIAILDYGNSARCLRLLEQQAGPRGQRITVDIDGMQARFTTSLIGSFQASNLLAAAGLALASGVERDAVVASLPALRGARGRMEHVIDLPSGATAFVDYSHKPDALAKALESLRPHVGGRLVVVFGCGGDRDPGKRPIMGEIAARLADRVFVTDDNPRNEDPAAIRAAILQECPGCIEIGDRRRAIETAINQLRKGDVLLVAGKGHETYQIVGKDTLAFDDAEVIREAARRLSGGSA